MGYLWQDYKETLSPEALEILPVLSFDSQIFFRVEGISKMTPLWDLDVARSLVSLETTGWVRFAKRMLNPKEFKGLEDDLYVALTERVERIQTSKDKLKADTSAESAYKQGLLPIL